MSKIEEEAVMNLRVSLRKRQAEVTKEYAEASAEYQIMSKRLRSELCQDFDSSNKRILACLGGCIDLLGESREKMARLGGYLAALEFSLNEIREKL